MHLKKCNFNEILSEVSRNHTLLNSAGNLKSKSPRANCKQSVSEVILMSWEIPQAFLKARNINVPVT